MQVHDQAHHDRRQTHQSVQNNNRRTAPAKPRDGQQRAKRKADQAGNNNRRQANPQRQGDDLDKITIRAEHQFERQPNCLRKVLHVPTA